MSHKKIKHQVRDGIIEAIDQVVSQINEEVGYKIKRSIRNSAKKLSNKFVKELKAVEKAEKKASHKKRKNPHQTTKQWLEGEEKKDVKQLKRTIHNPKIIHHQGQAQKSSNQEGKEEPEMGV